MYTHRYLEKTILTLNRTFKALYLGGPRQVGKTTLLLRLSKKMGMKYVTLDDLTQRRLAQEDPQLFLQQYPAPLFIDEVQYAPDLFPYLKIEIDQSPSKGKYWLTGSQPFALLQNIQESLAGRIGVLDLVGFSSAELQKSPPEKHPFLPGKKRIGKINHSTSIHDVFKRIHRGSFPALWQTPSPPLETFFNSYIQTYIDRDLREIFGVNKIGEFHRFLELCAARTGQMLSYSDLARDAGVSVHAAREWINILEGTRHIYLLRPYATNIAKRLIKTPKLYFMDTGLAAYLTKWKTPEALRSGAMAGAFFETFIVTELLKSYLFRGVEPPFYYLRDKEGHEIDLLVEQNQKLYPIEIKLAATLKSDHLHAMTYWKERLNAMTTGAVICLAPDPFWIKKQVEVVPVREVG